MSHGLEKKGLKVFRILDIKFSMFLAVQYIFIHKARLKNDELLHKWKQIIEIRTNGCHGKKIFLCKCNHFTEFPTNKNSLFNGILKFFNNLHISTILSKQFMTLTVQ